MKDVIQLYANANIRIAELERENAELRKDKKRLDWFAKYYTYKPMPLNDYRVHVDKLIEEMESKKEEAYPWANIWSNPTQ